MKIDAEFVIGVNTYVCDSEGKESILINEDNLLSAISVQFWYSDIRLKSSALIRSLIIGHPFQDGNKRTACIVGDTILSFNCDQTTTEITLIQIASGKIKDVEEIASLLYPET